MCAIPKRCLNSLPQSVMAPRYAGEGGDKLGNFPESTRRPPTEAGRPRSLAIHEESRLNRKDPQLEYPELHTWCSGLWGGVIAAAVTRTWLALQQPGLRQSGMTSCPLSFPPLLKPPPAESTQSTVQLFSEAAGEHLGVWKTQLL